MSLIYKLLQCHRLDRKKQRTNEVLGKKKPKPSAFSNFLPIVYRSIYFNANNTMITQKKTLHVFFIASDIHITGRFTFLIYWYVADEEKTRILCLAANSN